MNKLHLRVPTLDPVPAGLRGYYRPADGGGFILDHEDDPDGFGIDNIKALRGKLDEAQRDNARANKRLQGFSKPDGSLLSSEEVQAMAEQVASQAKLIETLQDDSSTDEQRMAELVANAQRPFEAEMAKLKQSNERYRAAAFAAEKQVVAARILEQLRPLDQWKPLLEAELARHIEIREAEDGTLSHVIIDPQTGKPRQSTRARPESSGRGKPREVLMDAAEFATLGELRKKFGAYLRGDGKRGADVTDASIADMRQSPRSWGGPDVVLTRKQASDIKVYEAAKARAKSLGGEVLIAP